MSLSFLQYIIAVCELVGSRRIHFYTLKLEIVVVLNDAISKGWIFNILLREIELEPSAKFHNGAMFLLSLSIHYLSLTDNHHFIFCAENDDLLQDINEPLWVQDHSVL